LCATTLQAQKKEKPKKQKHTDVTVVEIQPDPVASKSRPDRHPAPLEMPLFAISNKQGRGTGGSEAHGIDVSHYQGRINWDEVARDTKITYVYLKATEGTGNVDDTYSYNFNECKRVGLKVGSYLFFRPHLSVKGQFDLFVSRVDTRKQDLLPVIDAEAMNGVSDAVFQSRLLELCDLFEREYGKKPIIYTGKNFYNKHIYGNSRLRAYKFFIAAYSYIEPDLYGDFDYIMWQYSATGSVRGIRGNVDMSRFVGRHDIRDILYR
jgi:lysozyme